jgi:hypothetical protein
MCLCFLVLTLYYDLYQYNWTSWIHWNLIGPTKQQFFSLSLILMFFSSLYSIWNFLNALGNWFDLAFMVFQIRNTQNDYIFISSVICMLFFPLNFLNRMSGVMVSALALIAVDCGFGSNQRLSNWYLLLLR